MATQVYTESLQIEIGVLEAEPLDSSGGPAHSVPYPYPPLKHTGTRREAELPVVALENELIKACMAPSLGGRLLRILDKRTGIEALSCRNVLEPEPRGPRGFRLSDGLQVVVGAGFRPNAMGPVDTSIEEPADEDEPGSVWFAELVLGTRLSFHARYSLAPDSACIELEVRAFNRSLRPQAYSAWVDARVPGQTLYSSGGVSAYDDAKQAGLALCGDNDLFDVAAHRRETLTLGRFAPGVSEWLGPRQLDCWALRIVPYTGLEGLTAFSADAGLWIGPNVLQVQATHPIPNAKLLVLCENGQTVEAKIDLESATRAEVSSAGLPSAPKVVVVKGATGDELLRWERGAEHKPVHRSPIAGASTTMAALRQAETGVSEGREHSYFEGIQAMEEGRDGTAGVSRALSVPALRAPARVALAMMDMRAGRRRQASARLADALSFNAEDHLCWWLKARADRLADLEGEHGPELPNAHYLAPLEPALRAEAFLSTPVQPDPEPTALLKPMADDLESWVEVACRLLESGLYEECSRWIDEGLRHADAPRLRYLAAYVCVVTERMAAEAANHVARAAATPFAPPYPWQPVEVRALRALSERFSEPNGPAHILRLVLPLLEK
jgi:hypothetical protein